VVCDQMKERFVMSKKIFAICFALILMAISVGASARAPRPLVLGIRLGMEEDDARARLQKIGRQRKEEKKETEENEEEVWLLDGHPSFEYLFVGFDDKHHVRYVTVVMRKGGRRVRYSEMGNTKAAVRASDTGNYRFTWKVAAIGKRRGYLAIARGSDPVYLSSYSIKAT